MSGTTAPGGNRLASAVSVVGVVLLAGGVAAAIIIRIVTTAIVISGPMQVLSQAAYAGYSISPAKPYVTPYALSDALVPLAFGVAAFGLLVLVVGVAIHSTARRAR